MRPNPISRSILIPGMLFIAVVSGAWWVWQSKPEPRDVPVIIYLVDTLRADRLGVYGYTERATSPRLDALANESVVFNEVYAPAPWTLPSVASMLTSTYLCEHYIFSGRNMLNASFKTLPELLQGAGYFTGGAYTNLWVGPGNGLARGYDNFIFTGGADQRHAPEMKELLQQAGDRPFYLYMHTMEPHDAHAAHSEYIQKLGHVGVEIRAQYKDAHERFIRYKEADWEKRQPPGTTDNTALLDETMAFFEQHKDEMSLLYDAAVLQADSNLGEVIDALREAGIWDQAIFIFVSDHGEEIGEHGGWFHDQSLYEELTRVPLLIHFPASAFAGRRIDGPVSLIDVMPTILDYLGRSELCAECRGNSLMGALRGESLSPDNFPGVKSLRFNQRSFYKAIKRSRGDANVAVRQGPWKGIWNIELETLELYDLTVDPGELNNVSAREPELANRIAAQTSSWLQSCAETARPPQGPAKLDEDAKEQLRSMGYLN